MLPDMSDTVECFAVNASLDTYQIQSVDFVDTAVLISSLPIKATIQPATPEQLQALEVDVSLKYVMVHSTTQMDVGQYVVDGADTYKIVTPSDYQKYGFTEVVGEEVKGAIT